MAFGAVGFRRHAESFLFPVMTDPAVLILSMGFLGHLQIFFLHFEDFRMTIRAFKFLGVYVIGVTEEDGSCVFGLEDDVSAAHFFLSLSQSNRQSNGQESEKEK
jgi:hypothetical protein